MNNKTEPEEGRLAPIRRRLEQMSWEERLMTYALLRDYPPMSCVKLPGLCEMLEAEQAASACSERREQA